MSSAPTPTTSRPPLRKLIVACVFGPTLEWYDFFIYSTAAALVFNKLFFPSQTPLIGTLLAFSTFAVGVLARPLGAVLFGHLGDKHGRKRALVPAMLLMGGGTTVIGILPTAETIGALAPILLVTLRILQGVAIGGMWAGANLVATENAPSGRMGIYGSLGALGTPFGLLLANAVFLIVTVGTTDQQFLSWGWRIPFLLSVILAGVAFYVKFHMSEPVAVQQVQAEGAVVKSPVTAVLRRNTRTVMLLAGTAVILGSGFYFYSAYMLSYGSTVLGVSKATITGATALAAGLMIPALLAFAALSDKYGHRRTFIAGVVLTGAWVFPAFLLVNTAKPALITLALCVGLIIFSASFGPQAAFFTDLFSAELRYSGAGIGVQVGVVLGGAFTPMIATWLYAQFESFTVVALYLILTAAASAICALALRSHSISGNAAREEDSSSARVRDRR